jgi:hypothetical protein
MKNNILFFIIACFWSNFFLAQKTELDVREQDLTEFPIVKGKLWVRNPEGIKTEGISFLENDRSVSINFRDLAKVDSIASNKSILFLVLHTPNRTEMDWYKEVIKEAIRKGALHKGDKIEVLSYGNKIDNQLLFPSFFRFTDNADDLFNKIDSITINSRPNSNSRGSHIYLAINEALELYGKENVKMPSAIFVLADDRAFKIEGNFNGELPGSRSKRLNIPVYGISYFKSDTPYEISGLCSQTYGLYFRDNSNNIANSSDQLLKFMNDLNQRYVGVIYPFSYTSTFEKDGETHIVKIDSKEGQSGFALLVPNKNLFEWIRDNLILSIILFLVLSGMIVVLFQFNKKNKLKKLELQLKQKAQMSEMERQQQESEAKLGSQETELKRIIEEEKRKKVAEERNQKEKKEKDDDDQLLRMMLERGNLPWFKFKFENESGQYQIDSPRFKVGRDATNNWTINHPTVSRNHFILNFRDYKYMISDLGSSNGLIVNGNKITEVQLKHGDHIQVGEISLTFHI